MFSRSCFRLVLNLTVLPGMLLLLPAQRAHAQVGIALSPMRIELNAKPGSVESGVLTIGSDVPVKVRIRAEVLDFFVDETATPQFERAIPTEMPYSCRQWLTLNPMESELEPQSKLAVRYTLRIPAGVQPQSFYCAAGFTTMPSAESLKTTGFRMAVRLVSVLYVVIGNPAPAGELADVKLETLVNPKNPKESRSQAVVVVRNKGAVHLRPTGELQVIDSQGKVVERVEMRSLPALPMRDQRYLFPLESLSPAAKYTFKARVDLGTSEVLEAAAEITAPAAAN